MGDTTEPCACVECRIRYAIHGAPPEPGSDAREIEDFGTAITALSNVMAELLAHVPTRVAKGFANELLLARKRWQKEPRVAVQLPPHGRA